MLVFKTIVMVLGGVTLEFVALLLIVMSFPKFNIVNFKGGRIVLIVSGFILFIVGAALLAYSEIF